MKNFILLLCMIALASCQKDDASTNSETSDSALKFITKKVERPDGATSVILDYRFDENNRVLYMYHEENEDRPFYTYNYSPDGQLTSIDYTLGSIQIDNINYNGRVDVEEYSDTFFKGSLNIYDDDFEYVATLQNYEMVFDGQLIKKVYKEITALDYELTNFYEHDSQGRLVRTKEKIDNNPLRDNWEFYNWTEEAAPVFNFLNYTYDMAWFPDKFYSIYGVTEGAFRMDEASTFLYEFEFGDQTSYDLNWIGYDEDRKFRITFQEF